MTLSLSQQQQVAAQIKNWTKPRTVVFSRKCNETKQFLGGPKRHSIGAFTHRSTNFLRLR